VALLTVIGAHPRGQSTIMTTLAEQFIRAPLLALADIAAARFY